jgi:hypothetical protein
MAASSGREPADERDRWADERERVADERERVAGQREIDAHVGASRMDELRSRQARFAGTAATMRARLVALALEVARVEDEVATTFDLKAQRDAGDADRLLLLAAAARRRAESEGEWVRRFRGG